MSSRIASSAASTTVSDELRVESWIAEQAERTASEDWLTAISARYPEAVQTWTDPAAQIRLLKHDTNFLKSAESLPWSELLDGERLKILDFGAGTGWLSLLLSRYPSVEEITVLDSDRSNLETMLPRMASLFGGEIGKLRPVVGRFSPLLVPDGYFDLIVESSAIHHAESLSELLSELKRALRPGGYLVLVNETVLPDWMLMAMAISRALKIVRSVLTKRWQPNAPAISATTVVTDPFLGDRAYCSWQWEQALRAAGFDAKAVPTPFHTYNVGKQSERTRLVNFICRRPLV